MIQKKGSVEVDSGFQNIILFPYLKELKEKIENLERKVDELKKDKNE